MSSVSDQETVGAILALLKSHPGGGMTIRHLLSRLDLPENQRRRIRRLLNALMREGQVVSEGRGRYTVIGPNLETEGMLVSRGRGRLFLEVGQDGVDALAIHPDDRGGALPGDLVRAAVVRRRASGPSDGRVVQILRRGGRPIVGVYHQRPKAAFVDPDNPELGGPILVDRRDSQGAIDGLVVAVRVDDPAPLARPRGRVVEVLGEPGQVSTELSRLLLDHRLKRAFPPEVEAELDRLPTDGSVSLREDLRHIPHLTIDPPDAKDFDDAVFVEAHREGYRLLVSIADVSAFVAPGGMVDREALDRGCSVYLPSQVFPMLPARLSGDVCTLSPGRDRATITVELMLDRKGRPRQARVFRSLIRSAARLTYQEAQRTLDGEQTTGEAFRLIDQLRAMAECAKSLLSQMEARGALDLDLPEPEIRLDKNGQPIEVKTAERLFAHRIIEAFMIAANEAVAEILSAAGAPTVYRVHPAPDPEKMKLFSQMAKSLGAPVSFGRSATPSPGQLSRYLRSLEGRPVKAVLNQLLLRSLMQARYSERAEGHYGLASPNYLHFTSPIRRYPDLAVHRQLACLLKPAGREGVRRSTKAQAPTAWLLREDQVAGVAEQCSRAERRALDAERAAVGLYQAAYMRDHLGEVFGGVVSFVFDFGVFVRMLPSGVEGLVHVSRMRDDYYQYAEDRLALIGRRSRRSFRMGMKVRVRVESVQLAQRQVDLTLVDARGE